MIVVMQIKVLKFGGTSQLHTTYEMILSIINKDPHSKYIIILSAITGITNKLIEFVDTKNFSIWNQVIEINKKLSINYNSFLQSMEEKLWDLENDKIEIIAMGEFMTTNILNDYLVSNNIKSKFVSSFESIKSSHPNNNSLYNKGQFIVNNNLLFNHLENNQVLIIPGFSGLSSYNEPCLLGRGGSDTTGSIIAAAVNALEYQIWTDVDGIFSSDPRKIKNTFLIKNIGYNQAQEIAAMGAKVIHPFCILPCAQKNIPILIKNTFNKDGHCTIISHYISKLPPTNVTIQGNVTVFKITSSNMWNNYGFVFDIFSTFKNTMLM
jgi:aspartate kinase